jgi:hypothetical protein
VGEDSDVSEGERAGGTGCCSANKASAEERDSEGEAGGEELITARFPQASFVVEEGCDPEGIYLLATVDIADTDEVMAVVGDRLVALQVEEGLPLYVTPLRPITRILAQLREREAAMPSSPLPLP